MHAVRWVNSIITVYFAWNVYAVLSVLMEAVLTGKLQLAEAITGESVNIREEGHLCSAPPTVDFSGPIQLRTDFRSPGIYRPWIWRHISTGHGR